jgi:taurine dioxygenase
MPMLTERLKITPASDVMGAVITGTDLSRPLDEGQRADIRRAFLDAHILIFRDQSLDEEQFSRFAGTFGEIETHVVKNDQGARWSAVHRITNLDAEGHPAERPFTSSTYVWHTDKSFLPVPASATLLQAIELPPAGGDTEFADMTRAYETLPDTMKERLEGLRVVQSLEFMRRHTGSAPASEDDLKTAPPVEHPLVRTHPETGEKSLYIGHYCSHVAGLPEDEGRALLEELLVHATQPQFIFTQRWQPGDLIVWDNRCLLHRAMANYQMAKHRRILMRVVVKGSVPS